MTLKALYPPPYSDDVGAVSSSDYWVHSIFLDYDTNYGLVTVNPIEPVQGDLVTITVTPSDSDYVVSELLVTDLDGSEIDTTESEADDIWSFVMSDSLITVKIRFISISEWLESAGAEYQPEIAVAAAKYVCLLNDGTLVWSDKIESDSMAYWDWSDDSLKHPWVDRADLTSNIINVRFDAVATPVSTAKWFMNCTRLTSIDWLNLDTSHVIDMHEMFFNCSSLKSLDLSSLDTHNVTNMGSMFRDCNKLQSICLDINTSSVTDMQRMFYFCTDLVSLDLSSFDTSSVTDMCCMFYNCRSLELIDVSSFDTSSVTDMNSMFDKCASLRLLDVHNFNTGSCKFFSHMFMSCSSLTDLDVSNFDTSSAVTMSCMFSHLMNVTSLSLCNFNTSFVTNMSEMFCGCENLIWLDVSSFDTRNVKNMRSMFQYCSSLVVLDLSSFDTRGIASADNYMLEGLLSLTSLKVGENWVWRGLRTSLVNITWYDFDTHVKYTKFTLPDGAGFYVIDCPCVDNNGDNNCDICSNAICEHVDSNNDYKCDICGKLFLPFSSVDGNPDVNLDESVNVYDLNYILCVIENDNCIAVLLLTGDPQIVSNICRADLNNDGVVDQLDVDLFLSLYVQTE